MPPAPTTVQIQTCPLLSHTTNVDFKQLYNKILSINYSTVKYVQMYFDQQKINEGKIHTTFDSNLNKTHKNKPPFKL